MKCREFWFLFPAVILLPIAAVLPFQSSPAFQSRTRHHANRICKLDALATLEVNIDESTPRDVGSMDQWATTCGVQRSDGFQLTITNEEPLDVGAMTTQDLPAESPVLFVPSEMILSANRAKQEFGRVGAAEDLFQTQGVSADDVDRFYLFLKMLFEHEKGDQSPWYPWLNSLPRYFSNGASMTHFCCSNCLPPLVGNLAIVERTRFRQFFRALGLVDFLSKETKVYKSLALWAHNIVYTRSFEDGYGDIKIAPMADMFNHATEYEIRGEHDEEGNYCAYATRDLPAGSPLRTSYTSGDSTNPSFLFARYGFLDESSPATFCKIMISNPTPELVNMGYDHSRMLFYRNTGDVSEEVWDVLLYQILEYKNPTHQQALYEAHMRGDDDTKRALHQQYFTETSSALTYHVETFLDQLDELTTRAVGRDLKLHPRLPLILQHNEFVKETFLKVKAKLQ